ncbi:MAG: DUF2470 domain-containing protein [Gemmatimonadetes bacterium]|nr:MAG: DUF2470 domain-containing protein [Gemmatimonadota bacterium]
MPHTTAIQTAAELYRTVGHGILATHSVQMPGYPFGSVAPYCVDRHGQMVILISRIAQHTKNIQHDPHVSLTLVEASPDADVQAHGRITYLGQARRTEDVDAIAERYYRYFPQARGYHTAHDFDFWTIHLTRIRYIGGFGKIFWIEPADFLQPNPFDETTEKAIIDHMNTDHQAALRHYFKSMKSMEIPENEPVTMVGIDAFGIDTHYQHKRYRFTFPAPVHTAEEARQALVQFARSEA